MAEAKEVWRKNLSSDDYPYLTVIKHGDGSGYHFSYHRGFGNFHTQGIHTRAFKTESAAKKAGLKYAEEEQMMEYKKSLQKGNYMRVRNKVYYRKDGVATDVTRYNDPEVKALLKHKIGN